MINSRAFSYRTTIILVVMHPLNFLHFCHKGKREITGVFLFEHVLLKNHIALMSARWSFTFVDIRTRIGKNAFFKMAVVRMGNFLNKWAIVYVNRRVIYAESAFFMIGSFVVSIDIAYPMLFVEIFITICWNDFAANVMRMRMTRHEWKFSDMKAWISYVQFLDSSIQLSFEGNSRTEIYSIELKFSSLKLFPEFEFHLECSLSTIIEKLDKTVKFFRSPLISTKVI